MYTQSTRSFITSIPLLLQHDQIQAPMQSRQNRYAGVKIALHLCSPLSTLTTTSISCKNTIVCRIPDSIIAFRFIRCSSSSLIKITLLACIPIFCVGGASPQFSFSDESDYANGQSNHPYSIPQPNGKKHCTIIPCDNIVQP